MTNIKEYFNTLKKEISLARTKKTLNNIDKFAKSYARKISEGNSEVKGEIRREYRVLKSLLLKKHKEVK